METGFAEQDTETVTGLLMTGVAGEAVTVQVCAGADGCVVTENAKAVPLVSVFGAAPSAVLPFWLRRQPALQRPVSAFVRVNGFVPVSPETLTVKRNGLGVQVTVTLMGVAEPAVPVALPESVQVSEIGVSGCALIVTL